jgi:hypothetical protein
MELSSAENHGIFPTWPSPRTAWSCPRWILPVAGHKDPKCQGAGMPGSCTDTPRIQLAGAEKTPSGQRCTTIYNSTCRLLSTSENSRALLDCGKASVGRYQSTGFGYCELIIRTGRCQRGPRLTRPCWSEIRDPRSWLMFYRVVCFAL